MFPPNINITHIKHGVWLYSAIDLFVHTLSALFITIKMNMVVMNTNKCNPNIKDILDL